MSDLKNEKFKKELFITIENMSFEKGWKEGIYIFNGMYIDLSKVENMEDLIWFFYREGANKKLQEIKNVLSINEPRI
jgi:hypothetical protein